MYYFELNAHTTIFIAENLSLAFEKTDVSCKSIQGKLHVYAFGLYFMICNITSFINSTDKRVELKYIA